VRTELLAAGQQHGHAGKAGARGLNQLDAPN
jgi:hypothetical protein